MRRFIATAVAVGLVALPGVGRAQLAAPAAPPAEAQAAATPAVDPTALGVSLSRISRRLEAAAVARSQGDSPLRLEYFVDVYGSAPALRFFTGENLRSGAVPGTSPTHADMLYQMTPQAFRSPRVDFLGLAVGAATAGARKVKDWRYERDLRAYQKLIESGRIVPAPQPPKQ